jgi:hypothetical protein
VLSPTLDLCQLPLFLGFDIAGRWRDGTDDVLV